MQPNFSTLVFLTGGYKESSGYEEITNSSGRLIHSYHLHLFDSVARFQVVISLFSTDFMWESLLSYGMYLPQFISPPDT